MRSKITAISAIAILTIAGAISAAALAVNHTNGSSVAAQPQASEGTTNRSQRLDSTT